MADRLGNAEQELYRALAGAHERGWRMVDILHALRKFVSAVHLEALRATSAGLRNWQLVQALPDDDVLDITRRLTRVLDRLPECPRVSGRSQPGLEDKLLTRVRALLAKAESTTYEPEADALTAKAHELMARYSIDGARVGAPVGAGDVVRRRVLIDDPYAYQRIVLLSEVAVACGCRVLAMLRLGVTTVFGLAADVEATEVLYTSLLLQASAAMLAAPETPTGVAPSQVAAFRRAFLTGFAGRVGDRLCDLRRAVVAEECARGDLLPVLRSREELVDADMAQFGGRASRPRRLSDGVGLWAGERAGDHASLSGSVVPPPPRRLTG